MKAASKRVVAIRDLLARHERMHGLAEKLRGRTSVLRSGPPLHREPIHEVFFIVGSGRSGTTLVRRILMSSPHVHIPPETHVLGRMIGTYRRYDYLPWRELVRLCLAQLQFHREFVHFEMSLGPVARELYRLPRKERSLARILYSVFEAHARSVDRDDAYIFGEKTPNSTEQMHRIRVAFPEGRFVHMVRDGFDVARSFADAGMFPLEEAARLWVRRTKTARRFTERYPQSCITVRYEDLVSEPVRVVGELTDFLDIDSDTVDIDEVGHVEAMGDVPGADHHERVSEPIDSERVGRWRGTLDDDQLGMLEAIMGSERRRWGYGTPIASNDPPAHARS